MQGIVFLGINERLTLRGVLGKAASQCLSNISEECVCVCVCVFSWSWGKSKSHVEL